jgi:hypothetical protein
MNTIEIANKLLSHNANGRKDSTSPSTRMLIKQFDKGYRLALRDLTAKLGCKEFKVEISIPTRYKSVNLTETVFAVDEKDIEGMDFQHLVEMVMVEPLPPPFSPWSIGEIEEI